MYSTERERILIVLEPMRALRIFHTILLTSQNERVYHYDRKKLHYPTINENQNVGSVTSQHDRY